MEEFNDTVQQELPQDTPVPDTPPEASAQKASPMPRVTYYLLLCIFASVFLLSAVYLGHYFWELHQASSNNEGYASLHESLKNEATATDAPTTAPTEPGETNASTAPTETTAPSMVPEMEALYQLNSDIVGWLTISGLRVDYPVMQTPAQPNYYLYRDFNGSDSSVGSLYVREACDVFSPSDNVVIYGHAMKSGDMFGRLAWYRERSYWEKHPTFTFDTLYEHHTYQIFAVFKTSGTYGVGYPYHLFNEAASEEEFDQFIADVKGAAFTSGGYAGSSLYDTGITPKYGDKLLTLSTCEYSVRDPDGEKNGRFVIMAVRID